MNARAALLVTLSLSTLYIAGTQFIGAHPIAPTSNPSPSASVTSVAVEPPKPGDSYRITYYNDGQSPTVEGVSTDPSNGQRYWSGPQDITPFLNGKSAKEYLDEEIDKATLQTVEIYAFKKDDPNPPGKIRTMHPPWNTHCHRTVYIGGVPYVVHC